MATFEDTLHIPGYGIGIIQFLYYHEAQILKCVNNYCKEVVSEVINLLVPVFSYTDGILTFNKNKNTIKTCKNCMTIGINKIGNKYTLEIEKYIYCKGQRTKYYQDDDYTEPSYEIKTVIIKISKRSAKNYISAIKFLAHTIKKKCYKLNCYNIKLYLQPLPEHESDYDYNEYDDYDDYYNSEEQHYLYYSVGDYDYSQYDYDLHTKNMEIVMSELQDFFMNRMFN